LEAIIDIKMEQKIMYVPCGINKAPSIPHDAILTEYLITAYYWGISTWNDIFLKYK
jgi:hypothetical protein